MTNENEMPSEIYAGMDRTGETYWMRSRHEAFDNKDAIKQCRFVRADLVPAPDKTINWNYIEHAKQLLDDFTGDDGDVINAHTLLENALAGQKTAPDKAADSDFIFEALMSGLMYAQDAEALEKAGLETGYKKGTHKKAITLIEKALSRYKAKVQG